LGKVYYKKIPFLSVNVVKDSLAVPTGSSYWQFLLAVPPDRIYV